MSTKWLAKKLIAIVKDDFKKAVRAARGIQGMVPHVAGANKAAELLEGGSVDMETTVDPNGSNILTFAHTDKDFKEVHDQERDELVWVCVETDVKIVTTERGGRVSLHMVHGDESHALAEVAGPKLGPKP